MLKHIPTDDEKLPGDERSDMGDGALHWLALEEPMMWSVLAPDDVTPGGPLMACRCSFWPRAGLLEHLSGWVGLRLETSAGDGFPRPSAPRTLRVVLRSIPGSPWGLCLCVLGSLGPSCFTPRNGYCNTRCSALRFDVRLQKYLTETGSCSVLAVEATTREEIAKTLGVSGSSPRRRLWQDPEKLRVSFGSPTLLPRSLKLSPPRRYKDK